MQWRSNTDPGINIDIDSLEVRMRMQIKLRSVIFPLVLMTFACTPPAQVGEEAAEQSIFDEPIVLNTFDVPEIRVGLADTPSHFRFSSASAEGVQRMSAIESVTIRLISSGMVQSRLLSPASR